VLPSLTHGQQVMLSEFGHSDDIWEIQPEETARLVNSFFSTGVADVSQFSHQPVAFDVGWIALLEMLKIILGAVVAVLLGLVALVWFAVRRIWQRRKIQS
jgi:hypothetical protein